LTDDEEGDERRTMVDEQVKPASAVRGVVVPRAVAQGIRPAAAVAVENGVALTGKSEIDAEVLLAVLREKIEPADEVGMSEETDGTKIDPHVMPASAEGTPAALKSEFGLERFHLCTEIQGFGSTKPRLDRPVRPGERVLAYVEVVNFSSLAKDGLYETLLGAHMTLEDETGKVLFSQRFDEISDRCPTPRRDFFCHFLFTVPTTVQPGTYVLRLHVEDRMAKKTTTGAMALVVGEPFSEE
jgi:hypothetical protein